MRVHKSNNHIASALRHPAIVFAIFGAMLAFGIYSLPRMNKDEFPQFTIRQAVSAAVYPGANAADVEQQVTIPLENYLYTFAEINRANTYSVTEDGICYIYADLRLSVERKDEAWAKIRAGLQLFKTTSLPAGVLQVVVIDDFGNTSTMLLAVESPQRSPRELRDFASLLCDHLRRLDNTGRVQIMADEHEEIAILPRQDYVGRYNLSTIDGFNLLAFMQGAQLVNTNLEVGDMNTLVEIDKPYRSEYELQEQIIARPASGEVRLGDVATITRRYAKPDRWIQHNDAAAVIVNIEMTPGNNIVAYGQQIEQALAECHFPPDVQIHKITNQPKVVDDSVSSFLGDLLLSMLVVIAVMLVLFPLRTALVSSTGVPVCIGFCIGMMYITGIELNTVTLAALITVLGMIVDDSVIVIDGYSEALAQHQRTGTPLGRGYRAFLAQQSTRQLFVPMTLATFSISGMFFPMTKIITGPLGEFVQLFPFAVLFALTASIFYAAYAIPWMATHFIRQSSGSDIGWFERLQNRFFALLQNAYHRVLTRCFAHPRITLFIGVAMVLFGVWLFTRLNVQMLPKADRECFAVEIHLTEGSSVQQTAIVADSLATILRRDERVLSVTEFIGQASPRFHATYTPQTPASNYAQFIVDTRSPAATAQVLREYGSRYADYFPNAYCRFKQMDYQAVKNPIEVRIQGSDREAMLPLADSIAALMRTIPSLTWVHDDFSEQRPSVRVTLLPEAAAPLGISQAALSAYLAAALQGQTITQIWEGDYRVPVVLYINDPVARNDSSSVEQLSNLLIPTPLAGSVPLHTIADISLSWHSAHLSRRNNIATVTVAADLLGNASAPPVEEKLLNYIDHLQSTLPSDSDIVLSLGGLRAINNAVIPQLVWSVVAALAVMLALMVWHFGSVKLALLALSMALLCLPGTFAGLLVFGLDFSITALLGWVAVLGIIVRNAIIMYEYAQQLRSEGLSSREAAFRAGLRRMRPIFLTSATTALGVVPMILAHTNLWMPMGVAICFGTILTLPLVVTVLPIAYWKTHK